MPSIIKVDQIQSDLGTVNVSSNLQFSSGFTMRSPTFTGQATIPTINLTGGQIAFPATQVPSADGNTLDDYEEGSFQPSWSSTGASFTYDANYRHGRYTKIGNTVYFSIYISTSGAPTGTTSNFLTIIGLPFASGNIDNANICSFSYGQLWNVDWASAKIAATANIDRNSTAILLRWEQDSATSSSWAASALLASCYVQISGFYFV
jgi:hypothetical protein